MNHDWKFLKKLAKQKKAAFSLPEVLVSLFVLTFGILVVINFFGTSLGHVLKSRNQIIAAELAQEGLEIVRNIRDDNLIGGMAPFYTGFKDFSSNPAEKKLCTVDYKSTNVTSCGTSFDPRLYYDSGGYYTHTDANANPTSFQRRIWVFYDDGNGSFNLNTYEDAEAARVTAVVIWNRNTFPDDLSDCKTGENCYFIEEILADYNP